MKSGTITRLLMANSLFLSLAAPARAADGLQDCFDHLRDGTRSAYAWLTGKVEGGTAYALSHGRAVIIHGDRAFELVAAQLPETAGMMAFDSEDGTRIFYLGMRGIREVNQAKARENDMLPPEELRAERRPIAPAEAQSRLEAAVLERLQRFEAYEGTRLLSDSAREMLEDRLAAVALIAAALDREADQVVEILRAEGPAGKVRAHLEALLAPREGKAAWARSLRDWLRSGPLTGEMAAGALEAAAGLKPPA
jgi:hypothetical protein